MTIIDVFLSFPIWIRIIIAVPFIIWAVEVFLMPFKFNIWYHKYKDTEKLLEAILEASKWHTKDFNDTYRIISLVLELLDERKKEKKDVKDG